MRLYLPYTLFILIFCFGACQTGQKNSAEDKTLSADQQKAVAGELSKHLDLAYGAWHDAVIEQDLSRVARKLIEASGDLKKSLTHVKFHLLKTELAVIGPGLSQVIYISRGMLKAVMFDSELAFLVATELSLLRNGVSMKRYTSGSSIKSGWFNSNGLFDFGNKTYIAADNDAVKTVYDAHYDHRGGANLLERWSITKSTKDKASFLSPVRKILPPIDDRLENVRNEVAKLPPVRDPIVKTAVFNDFEERLKKD